MENFSGQVSNMKGNTETERIQQEIRENTVTLGENRNKLICKSDLVAEMEDNVVKQEAYSKLISASACDIENSKIATVEELELKTVT